MRSKRAYFTLLKYVLERQRVNDTYTDTHTDPHYCGYRKFEIITEYK